MHNSVGSGQLSWSISFGAARAFGGRIHKLMLAATVATIAGCGNDDGRRHLPPETAIDEAPAAVTNQTHVRIVFHSVGFADRFRCQLDSNPQRECGSPFETDVGDGPHGFLVSAASATTLDATPASVSWKVDTVPPDTTIVDAPPALDNKPDPAFTFQGTDDQGPVTFQCALDDAAFAACAPPATVAVADGEHHYQVRAIDAAGNIDPSPATTIWVVDTTAPDTIITTGPAAGATTGASVSFAFRSPDATATFECKLDAAQFAACTSPRALTLAGGSHTFAVRAKDPVGLVDPSPATRTWTVDTTPPSVTITATPSNPTNRTTGTFAFSSNDAAATFLCQIDAGGAFAPCTSGFTSASLADGPHTFTVRATDPVGNAATASFTWTIDTVAPTVTITASPPPATASSTATFSFTTAGAPVQVACSLDGGTFAACTSPRTITGNTDGMHTFVVRATDAADNVGSDMRTWIVDTTPPSVVITSGPANPTNNSRPTFAFTVTGATTVDCRVDGGAFAACTSPFTTAALADGSHTVTVRGTDAVGNAGTAAQTFTVDTVAPVVTVTAVTTPTNNNRPGVAFTVTGATTIRCQIDTGAFATCTSPFTPATALADGGHTITIRGTDAAGNVGTGATTFTVDTVAPVVTVTAVTTPTNNNRPSVAFTVTGAATIQCQIDTGTFAACTSPFTPATALADGSHTIRVRGTDAAGNIGNGSTTFTVDTTLPLVIVNPVFPNPTNNNRPSVTFTVSGDPVAIQCQVDTGAFAVCTSPFTPATALADGSHAVTVRVADAAGNVGTGSTTFTVDTVAPVVTVTAVTTPTSNNRPSVTFTVTGATTIQCRIDNGAFATCTSPFTPATALADGSHTITVRGTDAAGNAGTGSTTFTVDTVAPVVTVTAVTTPTNNNRPSVTFTVTGATTIECRIDTGTFAACTSPFTPATALADGSHTITVRGTDAAGNAGTGSTTFTVDTVAPVVTVTAVATPTNNNRPSVTFTVTGATTIQCRIDSGAFATCTSPFTPATALADGSHTITVRGTDAAGNAGTGSTTFTVDTVAPVVTVTAVTTPTNNNRPSVTFTVTGATTIQCRIDNGAFATCTSPFTPATALADGSHTITVRGTDAAGNAGTGSTTFTVDTVPPLVTVTAVPSPTNNNRPSVTFTVTGATTIQCRIDNGAFATCTSPFTPATALADGSHAITVRGTDAAGNAGTGSTTFTVDTVAPVVTVTAVPTPTRNNRPSVTFTVTGATTIQCRIDNGAFATCTSPFTPATALADGSHAITVRGTDAAGNAGTGSTTFTVDTVAPVVTVTAVPTPTRNNRPSVTFTVTGATTIQCRIDNGAFATCTSPFTPATALADGSHTITVRGTDAAGNAGTGSTTFTVDTVAPVVTVTAVPSPTRITRPSVTFTVTGATTIQCRIDSGAFATCTSPFTPATALADGSHTITVRGTDAAGNAGTGSTTFVVDTTPPGVVFDDAPPASWPVNYFDMRFHSVDTSATLTCSLNGAAFAACTSPRTITTVYNTPSTFAVRATDAAGNVSNASRSWTSRDGLVLHYPWEQGQTRNTSLLTQRPAYSPNGSATLTVVGGWAGTAASSPAAHTYANTIRPLSSSATGEYTVSVWARLSANASGTVVSTITAASSNGFALSIAGNTVTLQVKDNGTLLSKNVAVNLNQWVQLGVVAFTGDGLAIELIVNGNLRATVDAQTTNGFGAGQAANLTVGPITGADLDDLRFYNRGMFSDELCTTVVRGELGEGCVPLSPGVELDFEHGQIRDTGTWLLPLTAPTSSQFSFVSTGLGMGVQLSAFIPLFGYTGFSRATQISGHSFSTWFTSRNTTDGTDDLFENIAFCSEGGDLCGLEVAISPRELSVFVGDQTRELKVISLSITAGQHSLLITEQKVPDSFRTRSLSIYVDGVLTMMPLSGGNVFAGGDDTLRLGAVPGMVLDEIEFWPRDLSEDPEMLCENGLDGEWDPVDGSCSLVN